MLEFGQYDIGLGNDMKWRYVLALRDLTKTYYESPVISMHEFYRREIMFSRICCEGMR